MTRALVLGASGFIGLHVVDALRAAGVEVRALRRARSITLLLRRRPVEQVVGETGDTASLVAAMRGCDVVVHCAGHYPRYSTHPDESIGRAVTETRSFLRALELAGRPRAVVTGTIATLGPAPEGELASEAMRLDAEPSESPYRATKWAIEEELDHARASGLDIVSMLPGACLGPDDLRIGTSGILLGLLSGALPFWLEGWVNVVDVRDVASAHVAAALHTRPSSRYALPGRNLRMSALLPWLASRYDATLPAGPVHADVARVVADIDEREAEGRRGRVPFPRELVDLIATGQPVSGALAASELGATARALEHTFDETHACFRRRGLLPPAHARRSADAEFRSPTV